MDDTTLNEIRARRHKWDAVYIYREDGDHFIDDKAGEDFNTLLDAVTALRAELDAATARADAAERQRDSAWERLSDPEIAIISTVRADLADGFAPTILEAEALLDIIGRAYKITENRPDVKRAEPGA